MSDKTEEKNIKPKKEEEKLESISSNIKDAPEETPKEEKVESGGLLGLEELPEEVRKKIEKKKAEQSQKQKKGKTRKRKKKVARKVPIGNAYIKATYNNTIVSLTDLKGNVISWASAGIAGFKGPKKSTPYAAQIITRLAVGRAREEYGLNEVSVFIKGVGTGRESAVRALNSNGLIVNAIRDVTPIPHNGCRKRKPRRV